MQIKDKLLKRIDHRRKLYIGQHKRGTEPWRLALSNPRSRYITIYSDDEGLICNVYAKHFEERQFRAEIVRSSFEMYEYLKDKVQELESVNPSLAKSIRKISKIDTKIMHDLNKKLTMLDEEYEKAMQGEYYEDYEDLEEE
jgi:hypothetical protein